MILNPRCLRVRIGLKAKSSTLGRLPMPTSATPQLEEGSSPSMAESPSIHRGCAPHSERMRLMSLDREWLSSQTITVDRRLFSSGATGRPSGGMGSPGSEDEPGVVLCLSSITPEPACYLLLEGLAQRVSVLSFSRIDRYQINSEMRWPFFYQIARRHDVALQKFA